MAQKREKTALGGRIWAALLSFGLIGQIAWVVENMYLNVFLYNTVTGDTGMIAAMVAASAAVAAVTDIVAYLRNMSPLWKDKVSGKKEFVI